MSNKKYFSMKEKKAAHCRVELERQRKLREAGLCVSCKKPVAGYRKGMVKCADCVESPRVLIPKETVIAIKLIPYIPHGSGRAIAMRHCIPYATLFKIRDGKSFPKAINPNSKWYRKWLIYKDMSPDEKLKFENSLAQQQHVTLTGQLRTENRMLKEKCYHLAVENQRLMDGKFTAEEIHGICHNLHGTVGPEAFAEGCRKEMEKLYGFCPWAKREQPQPTVSRDELERVQAEHS